MITQIPVILASAMALIIVTFTRFLWRRYAEFRSLHRPMMDPERQGFPSVSVLVPARNEELNLRSCLTALLSQAYPNYEVIIVDDQSTDGTPQIIREFARDPRVRAVAAPPLPPGWIGKTHALWTGSRHASGDWLFFVDADTFAGREMLAAAVAHAESKQLDTISLLPQQDLGSLSEKIIQPIVFAMLQIFLPPARANNAGDDMGHVAGQCLGIRRPVYEAIEGHKHDAVRSRTSEDAALGQVVKSAGYRLEIVDGRHLVHTRMYTGFGEIWNGWAKNFVSGLGGRWWLAPFALVSSLAVIMYFGLSLRGADKSFGLAAALNLATLVYLLAFLGLIRWKIGRVIGQPGWYAFTYPVGLVVVGGIAFTSLLRSGLGIGSNWKGRRYA